MPLDRTLIAQMDDATRCPVCNRHTMHVAYFGQTGYCSPDCEFAHWTVDDGPSEPNCWGFNSYEHYKGECQHFEDERERYAREAALDRGELLPEDLR